MRSFQFVAMFHINTEDAHRGGEDRWTCDDSEQAKNFDTAKDRDEKKQFVEPSAIAQ
jgi:hypothetical protein